MIAPLPFFIPHDTMTPSGEKRKGFYGHEASDRREEKSDYGRKNRETAFAVLFSDFVRNFFSATVQCGGCDDCWALCRQRGAVSGGRFYGDADTDGGGIFCWSFFGSCCAGITILRGRTRGDGGLCRPYFYGVQYFGRTGDDWPGIDFDTVDVGGDGNADGSVGYVDSLSARLFWRHCRKPDIQFRSGDSASSGRFQATAIFFDQ